MRLWQVFLFLNLAKEHGRVTLSFTAEVLQVNRNTVKKHLQNLVRNRKLFLHGNGREYAILISEGIGINILNV